MCKNQGFVHQSTASETERDSNFPCNCDDFDFLSAISTSLSAMIDHKWVSVKCGPDGGGWRIEKRR